MGKTRIAVLDGIRGMAFLFVILGHVSNYYGQFFTGFAIVGMWLFFALSAFLLTQYFLSDPKRTSNPTEWLIYALRRIMHILPPYLLILLIYFFGKYLITSPTDIFKHFILISGTGHFWTIPVEIKYYLILPFVVGTSATFRSRSQNGNKQRQSDKLHIGFFNRIGDSIITRKN